VGGAEAPFPRARTWHRSMDARSMMCRSARVYLVVGHPRPLPRAMPNATCRTHGPALRARPRDPGPSGNQPHLHGAVDVFHRSPGRCAAATRPLTRRGRMPGAWRGMRLGDLSAAASRRHDRYDPGGPPGQQAAIAALNRSAGRCQPSVLRGRSFISAATRVMSWTVCIRSVPFGK